jgi:hypothetical protein
MISLAWLERPDDRSKLPGKQRPVAATRAVLAMRTLREV